jgi:transposase-like protein
MAMDKNIFSEALFHDEESARNWFETARWPNGPVCPHCKGDKHYPTKKAGRYRCASKKCRKDFTVTTGTVMERSHVKLTEWAAAFHLAASSKKGFSAHQLHRSLSCQYNTAWFMFHRIREAMRRGDLDVAPMGGEGQIVEADETYYGPTDKPQASPQRRGRPFTKGGKSGPSNKRPILALVERGGRVRTFHVPVATKEAVTKIVRKNIAKESRLHTDESKLYGDEADYFAGHESVKHSNKEYVRYDGDETIHTNSAEGFFSIFKRGMRGIYQHCSEKHLHRYLAEFEFRYSHRIKLGYDDEARAVLAVQGGEGKRLTYHQPR